MRKLVFAILLLNSIVSYGNIDKKIYLKLNIAANKLPSFKQYSHISPEIDIGIGYYFNDIYRIDISTGYAHFNFDTKYRADEKIVDVSIFSGTKSFYYKAQTQFIILNHYLNIIRKEDFQIYIHGGIGINKIKERISKFFSGILVNESIISIPLTVQHYESKGTENFIYSLGLGITTKLNDNVNFDLTYNYKNFGKPKYEIQIISYVPNKNYKSHNLSIGIRFDL